MRANAVKLVTFRLGHDCFAVEIFAVERVLRYATPAPVPDVPPWIAGVIEHRAKVIPVVDMRRRIEVPDNTITPQTRTLVLNTADGWVGAIVDAVMEVVSVPSAAVSPPPPLFRGLAAKFVRGIAKIGERLVVILEVEQLLSSDDRIVLQCALVGAESA